MEVFTDDEIDKLIRLVSQHPSLFFSRNPNFKDLMIKHNIWKQIAEELNKTGEGCKKQWKVVRDGYLRHKRRNKLHTGKSKKSLKHRRTNWKIYRKLSFLDSAPEESPTISNMDVTPLVQDFGSGLNIAGESTESAQDKQNQDEQNQDKQNHDKQNQDKQDQESSMTLLAPAEKTQPLKKQKRNRSRDEILEYLQSRDESYQSQLLQLQKNGTDDVNSFAKYVEHVLKKLPLVCQIKAKQEIFGVVTKYELLASEEITASNTYKLMGSPQMCVSDESRCSQLTVYSPRSDLSDIIITEHNSILVKTENENY